MTSGPLHARTTYAQALTPRASAWRDLLCELIRIPSLFEAEQPLVARVAQHIHELGAAPVRVRHDPRRLGQLAAAQAPISGVADRFSLVVRVPGAGAGRSMIVNAHLDTVPPGDTSSWHYPPYAGIFDARDGAVYGRGAMDDKAGVVVCLGLLESLLAHQPRLAGDVIFQFVLEDETTGNGSLVCLDAGHVGDAALIVDGPRGDRAINAHAGQLQFNVEVRGKPASVSVSHLGVNAAEMMARLLVHLRDTVFAWNATNRAPWTAFPSPNQLVIQRLHAAGEQLTVPEAASAQCYVTFTPDRELAGVRRALQSAVVKFADEWQLPDLPLLDYSAGFEAEPVESRSMPLENALRSAAERAELPAIDIGPSTGTSDMRHFVARGIPCMLFGPGRGYNPHRPNEYFLVDDLPRMIACYLELLADWCGLAN